MDLRWRHLTGAWLDRANLTWRPSASSPATPCWPDSDTGVPAGRTPPTGTSWSRASAPWAPNALRSGPGTRVGLQAATTPGRPVVLHVEAHGGHGLGPARDQESALCGSSDIGGR
jgi:hypothetical protein